MLRFRLAFPVYSPFLPVVTLLLPPRLLSLPPSPSPSPTGAPKRRGWSNKEEDDEKSDEGGERDGEDSDGEDVTEGTTGELVRRACFTFCLDVLAPAASCGTCDTLRLPPPGARFGTVFDRRRPLAADRDSDALAPTLSRGESGGGPRAR